MATLFGMVLQAKLLNTVTDNHDDDDDTSRSTTGVDISNPMNNNFRIGIILNVIITHYYYY